MAKLRDYAQKPEPDDDDDETKSAGISFEEYKHHQETATSLFFLGIFLIWPFGLGGLIGGHSLITSHNQNEVFTGMVLMLGSGAILIGHGAYLCHLLGKLMSR